MDSPGPYMPPTAARRRQTDKNLRHDSPPATFGHRAPPGESAPGGMPRPSVDVRSMLSGAPRISHEFRPGHALAPF